MNNTPHHYAQASYGTPTPYSAVPSTYGGYPGQQQYQQQQYGYNQPQQQFLPQQQPVPSPFPQQTPQQYPQGYQQPPYQQQPYQQQPYQQQGPFRPPQQAQPQQPRVSAPGGLQYPQQQPVPNPGAPPLPTRNQSVARPSNTGSGPVPTAGQQLNQNYPVAAGLVTPPTISYPPQQHRTPAQLSINTPPFSNPTPEMSSSNNPFVNPGNQPPARSLVPVTSKVFGIHQQHPMGCFTELQETRCDFCDMPMNNGFHCDCDLDICTGCSNKGEVNQVPRNPVRFEAFHPHDLTWQTSPGRRCRECQRTASFSYHCGSCNYHLCLLCAKEITQAHYPGETPPPQISHPPRPAQHLPSIAMYQHAHPTPAVPHGAPSQNQLSVPPKPRPHSIKVSQTIVAANKPENYWLVISVESASQLRTGASTGKCDPYCTVTVRSGQEQLKEMRRCPRTSTEIAKQSPVWKCDFHYDAWAVKENPKVNVSLTVYDFDAKRPDFLGQYHFDIDLNQVTLEKSRGEASLVEADLKPGKGRIAFSVSRKLKAPEPDELEDTYIQWREIVEHFNTFPVISTLYMRFKYIFFHSEVGTNELNRFDLKTNSQLEKAYMRDKETLEITDGRVVWEVNFTEGKQKPKAPSGGLGRIPKEKALLCAKRLERWFWRDDDETYKPYDDVTQMAIWHALIYRVPTLTIQIHKHHYTINLVDKVQKNLKTGIARAVVTESKFSFMSWSPKVEVGTSEAVQIIALDPNSVEYQNVQNSFYVTMPRKTKNGQPLNTISKIEKVVNPFLRKHWEHELEMIKEKNKNDPNLEYVRLLFHGTTATDPKIIYESDKGWKLNYVGEANLWGRGLYFASDAVYSGGKYAFTTPEGKQKLLMAEVILGNSVHCEENKELREPPVSRGNKRFDSVIGNRHGTWIFVVYDNARAYPTYIIEYDPKR